MTDSPRPRPTVASLVPPPSNPVVDGESVETSTPPRVPGVGITVGVTAAAAAAGAGVVVVDATGATPVVTGDGVSSGSAAETGEGVGRWVNAVGSAVGGVGELVGESVGSGAGTGTDVCGGGGVG